MELNVEYPVVLLIGKTGKAFDFYLCGKSTLGNFLVGASQGNELFPTSAKMETVTKVCSAGIMLIDDVQYNIVDTPGLFDTEQGSTPILEKISEVVNKCAHRVKAILIVFEVQRFTNEQRNVLDKIRMFLGKDATNNIILVFSKANRVQTNNKNVMERDCVRTVSSFIQVIGNRWGISPNPDIFPPDEETFRVRLREIKNLIINIQGVYTTTQLEKNRNLMKLMVATAITAIVFTFGTMLDGGALQMYRSDIIVVKQSTI
ncbi:hypothetical protein RhiirC2_777656 [Rhizophagus irregularis]|uniref:AIG1-type G domain-containing protein n=1 Tax=Rhizophagus irregularis TaxID=588596 RepID=A0A2N1NDX1_9GLOM|nr:hypothetical protein RhiirC2_777656 [Rhizophagus irregularis]